MKNNIEHNWAADTQAPGDVHGDVTCKRIVAIFQPQAWQNGYAIDVDGRREIDVTEKVLALSLCGIQGLSNDDYDYDYDTDDLVDSESLGHDGPFYVAVSEQACAFFCVEHLSQVTEQMLLDARKCVSACTVHSGTCLAMSRDNRTARAINDEGSVISSSVGQEFMCFGECLAGVGRQVGSEVVGESYRRHYELDMAPSETVHQDRIDGGVLEADASGSFEVGQRVFLADAAPHADGWYLLHRVETVSGKIETSSTIVTLCPPDNTPGDYICVTASELRASVPVLDVRTSVRKTVIQFTVLHDDGKDLSSLSLGDIFSECDDGSYLGGGLVVISDVILTPDQIDAEAVALGSEATFFEFDSMGASDESVALESMNR
ncbi:MULTISPECIES: hypothetical protein [unclassified Paraburkholderia]|uniref:hypothetical protein n=1 Tax=unclassified Paraburkholderia TaxID=2615204 RepID=UPI002AB170EA|nr:MULTISPECIES: hypothetical protein [unclassified Paraburkholderia]